MLTNRTLLFVANLRFRSIADTVLSAIFGGRVGTETFTGLNASSAGNRADVPR